MVTVSDTISLSRTARTFAIWTIGTPSPCSDSCVWPESLSWGGWFLPPGIPCVHMQNSRSRQLRIFFFFLEVGKLTGDAMVFFFFFKDLVWLKKKIFRISRVFLGCVAWEASGELPIVSPGNSLGRELVFRGALGSWWTMVPLWLECRGSFFSLQSQAGSTQKGLQPFVSGVRSQSLTSQLRLLSLCLWSQTSAVSA